MTARANTVVHVDAATFYAEGVLAGLRTACNIIGRTDDGDVPPQLQAQVREWRAHVYHYQWLASRGFPADPPAFPERSTVMALIHAVLHDFPEVSDDD